ncbi:MAG: MBL fold metallo-hydrolase [Halanaeroarchaeum sp.]
MYNIQLTNNAFEGENSVYLLGADAAGPTTLVDTGVATDSVERELRAALAEYGVTFSNVDQVIVTHWHHDHAGLAGAIQSAGDASVYVHEADAPLVAKRPDAVESVEQTQRRCLDEWGMPEAKQRELLDFMSLHDDFRGDPVNVTPLTDGDVVETANHSLTVRHLPGHAVGLSAFVLEREGRREAFVGDAILPKYTPNVGGADVRVDAPLEKYLDSLDRIVGMDLDRVWPGHRGPIVFPSERARDIARHHEDRTERVYRVVSERGPVTAWEVSDALFGDLETIHILHGPGEAYAHLEHLVEAGILADFEGTYELATEDIRADDAVAAVRQ